MKKAVFLITLMAVTSSVSAGLMDYISEMFSDKPEVVEIFGEHLFRKVGESKFEEELGKPMVKVRYMVRAKKGENGNVTKKTVKACGNCQAK